MLKLPVGSDDFDAQGGKIIPHVAAAEIGIDDIHIGQDYILALVFQAARQMDGIFTLTAAIGPDDDI